MGNDLAGDDFVGCKLAYILEESLLVYKRDDIPEIPFPGQWDLPGGGREGQESPEACVLRELEEEFSLSLPRTRIVYKRKSISSTGQGWSYFFVIYGKPAEVSTISFGNEGQCWKLMPLQEYLSHPEGVPSLKARLQRYLDAERGR